MASAKGLGMIICFDFDGTLHDPSNRAPGYRMGKPVVGARELCQTLVNQGHTVLVHTCRVTKVEHLKHVYDWLAYFHFPPMAIHEHKPMADVYIDNRALRFDGDMSHLAVALHQLGFLHGTPRASEQASSLEGQRHEWYDGRSADIDRAP